jgi:hypothetical protein
MPIKPIDLQTLFLQMERVGKQQHIEKEGAVLQQSLHGAALQKKNDETARAVKAVTDDQKGAEAVKDEKDGSSATPQEGEKKKEPEAGGSGKETIKDPALGGHIDITG